jgi:hypothetical protein
MIPGSERYPFVITDPALGPASSLPYLPVELRNQQQTVSAMGLVDSASTINVLPFDVGIQMGFDWSQQTTSLQLTGNLANFEARAIAVTGVVGKFTPVLLAFAWTQSNSVPVILGQVNFLMEFDVYLSRSQSFFEVKPK